MQLALAMLVVASLPLAIVATQAFELAGAQAVEARKAERERAAVAAAAEIGRWVEQKSQAISGWAQLYPDLASRPPELQTGLLRSVYRAVPGAVTVALLDDDGIVASGGEPLAPVWLDASLPSDDPLADRPRGSAERAAAFLGATLLPPDRGQVGWGVPYDPPAPEVGGPAPEPAVAVAARSPFGDGAAIAVDLSLDPIVELLEDRAADGRAWALLSGSGEVVAATGAVPDGAALRPLLGQRSGTLFLADQGRVGALATVPGAPWAVVVTEPDLADPTWLALRSRLLAAIAVAAALAVLAGVGLAGLLTRPVVELRDAAARIAAGDLDRRVRDRRRDELGELARTFNDMASRLSHTLDELERRRREVEAANLDLEDRVRDRTRALELAQAELVRAAQVAAVSEVSAGLAHDLNNPLAAVLGVLQVLGARTHDAAVRDMVGRAEREALRCREVVAVMVRLAAPEAAHRAQARAELAAEVSDAVALVRGPLQHRRVSLAVDPLPRDLAVAADPIELRHALTQILQALGAGLPPGASLQISFDVDEHRARVRFAPDAPVGRGEARDGFLAAGLGLWVARGVLSARGATLLTPPEEDGPWVLVLPLV
jgi:two-component system, NtrC family, sensor kinase